MDKGLIRRRGALRSVRYTERMARRLLAFALASVIIGGPLAARVCAAACTEHAGHSIDSTMPPSHHRYPAEVVRQPSHHHHAGAAPAAATHRAKLRALWHACGHVEAFILVRAPLATAVVTAAQATPLLAHVWPTFQMDSRHGPPAPLRSTSPLRI